MYTIDTPQAIRYPATEAQIARLIKALTERIEDPQASLDAIKWVNEHRLSGSLVSAKITEYEAKPKVREAFSHSTTSGDLEVGMYRVDGEIYKVQMSQGYYGSAGRLYAKHLTEEGFQYAPGAIRKIRANHRMTLEEAKEYGRITNTCCVCGRTLTNEKSMAEGIGPKCSGKV